jgi:hypothetical protein
VTERDPAPSPDEERVDSERDRLTGRRAAEARIAQQQTWVDQQIRIAMARGDFDDLPGTGKPLPDLGQSHDPDWWIKKLVERENIALLPPSLQLRREDAELDARLDACAREADVRREIEDFNARVIAARYRLPEGPPLVTMPRDVDATVAAWTERREARRRDVRRKATGDRSTTPPAKRRWWQRGRGREVHQGM